ncbi:hypothetical protein [Natronorubrum daqingense]|uniref:Uncharacterized protein n=1 Tax=Natronorubrum daqingense TaxID=588898 RepID=A0A1N7FXC9_9EURY|nr:hypothetical protein [Natronorubrum daqingense]APX98536.1 hypothetical protein BB347_17670 [Natronorubrum daqingense]SIS05023.1 hypothetical protein SAMN05421809_3541 [Natronorubrum daqingense]
MSKPTPHRVATRLFTLFLCLLLVGTVLAATPVAADGPSLETDSLSQSPSVAMLMQTDDPDDNETSDSENESDDTETNESEDSDAPTQAESVRIDAETYDEDFLDVETEASDEVYNTSGPFATFSVSEPVDTVRIDQSQADAEVIGDGHMIRVEYDDDAAGEDASLYSAELFFEDGSDHTIDLFASDTDVSVEAAEYEAYSNFIDYTVEQAEAEGYEESPEGAIDYVQDTEERAELFDSLFTEHVLMFLTLLFTAAQNFVTWVVALTIIAGIAYYFERKHGWILRLQQRVESRGEIMREVIRQDYEKRRNAAAKHSLQNVDEIGTNAARYWREVDIETVDNMVQAVCKGIVKTNRDGEIEYDDDGNVVFAHHGVDDLKEIDPLTVEQLRSETWLSPLILEGRLAPTTALSNIESALLVAEKEYNRGNEVREARRTIEELNARLSGKRQYEHAETSSNAARPEQRSGPTGHAAGGD